MKFLPGKHAVFGLVAILASVLITGCAGEPVLSTQDLTQKYQQLPKPDIALNIPGLGPCNDNPDRSLLLNSQQPVTVLVHGCNGSAGRFRTLSEVLAFHGQQSACFSYNDRDSIIRSSGQLADVVEALATHLSVPRITVMGHSQGGLVARKAFVSERNDSIQSNAQLQLVTISAPLSGIRAARFCAIPLLRIATLGLHDLICWMISGDNWYEITAVSDLINNPGALIPSVERYLLVATDERDSCRRYNNSGNCIKDDFVFSLAEQKLPPVQTGVAADYVQVRAGHVEIVGESGVTPEKLIQVLQNAGIIKPTDPSRLAQFNELLLRLYKMDMVDAYN
ncbi:MAG: alpha/beta hydrolase [Gammaproteobacteria bacterium]|nr:alpha/beta hydrolase [Gammaproteobacteria bacterium]